MTDFSKAVIYNIYCKDKNVLEFYIGSTHDEIQREQGHKDNCNNEKRERHYNLKVYKFIRDNGGWDNWIFKVIQRFPCENKIQLVEQEQYHYDLLHPALNTYRPYVSEEERKEQMRIYDSKYYKDNREEIKIVRSKYYKDNREEIRIKQKQKFICDCGVELTIGSKKRHCDTNSHKKFILNRVS